MGETVDWRAAYAEAVGHADGMADLVRALRERTMDIFDWRMAAATRTAAYDHWRRTRLVP